MELGTQEILIALAALVIIGILIDGVRRVRNSRYDRIRMSRRKQPIFDDDSIDEFGSELPNGGARVVAVREECDSEEMQEAIREAAEANKPKLSFSQNKEQSQEQEFTESEAVEAIADSVDNESDEAVQEAVETVDEEQAVSEQVIPEQATSEQASIDTEVDSDSDPAIQPEQSSLALDEPVPVLMDSVDEPDPVKPGSVKQESVEPLFTSHTKTSQASAESTGRQAAAGEVIVFHLRAGDEPFAGNKLLDALVAQQMRYGSMKIFHRHAESDGSGQVLFSMANSVEPGTFDLNAMDSFTTPGVSFFIALDEVDEPSQAFGLMLETIGCVMEAVGGELKDETRSAVTRQTVEHYWQRVRDFERRMLAADA